MSFEEEATPVLGGGPVNGVPGPGGPDELNCTLWVGNLDTKITEAVLYELFMQVNVNPQVSRARHVICTLKCKV